MDEERLIAKPRLSFNPDESGWLYNRCLRIIIIINNKQAELSWAKPRRGFVKLLTLVGAVDLWSCYYLFDSDYIANQTQLGWGWSWVWVCQLSIKTHGKEYVRVKD